MNSILPINLRLNFSNFLKRRTNTRGQERRQTDLPYIPHQLYQFFRNAAKMHMRTTNCEEYHNLRYPNPLTLVYWWEECNVKNVKKVHAVQYVSTVFLNAEFYVFKSMNKVSSFLTGNGISSLSLNVR